MHVCQWFICVWQSNTSIINTCFSAIYISIHMQLSNIIIHRNNVAFPWVSIHFQHIKMNTHITLWLETAEELHIIYCCFLCFSLLACVVFLKCSTTICVCVCFCFVIITPLNVAEASLCLLCITSSANYP